MECNGFKLSLRVFAVWQLERSRHAIPDVFVVAWARFFVLTWLKSELLTTVDGLTGPSTSRRAVEAHWALLLLERDPQLVLRKAAMGRRLAKPAWHLGCNSRNPYNLHRTPQTVTSTRTSPALRTKTSYDI